MAFLNRRAPSPTPAPAPGSLAAAAPLAEIAETPTEQWTAADLRAVTHEALHLERYRIARFRFASEAALDRLRRHLARWVAVVVAAIIVVGVFAHPPRPWWLVVTQGVLLVAGIALLAVLQSLATEVRARRWERLLDDYSAGAEPTAAFDPPSEMLLDLGQASAVTNPAGSPVGTADTAAVRNNGRHRTSGPRTLREPPPKA